MLTLPYLVVPQTATDLILALRVVEQQIDVLEILHTGQINVFTTTYVKLHCRVHENVHPE